MADAPVYQPDPRIEQAREAFASGLGSLASEVKSVQIGRMPKDENGHFVDRITPQPNAAKDTEELIVTAHIPGFDLEQKRLTDEARAKLATMAPLADKIQMVPQEQLTVQLRNDITQATAGTNFNTGLLEWQGFKPEVLGKGFEIGNFALQDVGETAYGVKATLHFAHAEGEDPSPAIERFKELTEGRLEAIKEIQVDRAIKYNRINLTERGLNAQEIDHLKTQAQTEGKNADEMLAQALENKIKESENKIREDYAKMIITPNIDRDNLIITLRSPEQAAAYEKADPRAYQQPANADELRNTNPLTSRIVGLTNKVTPATDTTPEKQPQLHKLLARSILFDKDKNIAPDALQIMGRNDIKAALATEFIKRVLPKHPEKEAELRKILDSELFKNHDYWHNDPGKAGVGKPEPVFTRLGNDTVEISFTLRQDKDPAKNDLLQIVQALATANTPSAAALAGTTQTTAQPTVSADVTPQELAPIANAQTQLGAVQGPEVNKATIKAIDQVLQKNSPQQLSV